MFQNELHIKILEHWIAKQGFEVVRGKKLVDELLMKKKQITLCTSTKPKHQLYSLLHECRTLDYTKE